MDQGGFGAVWNSRYDDETYLFGTDPNDFLVSVESRMPRGGRVLCLGDGEGRNGVWLAALGHRVSSVDLSEVGLRKAQALAAARGVEIETEVADLMEWVDTPAASGPWDAIVSIFCHLPPEVRSKVGQALGSRLTGDGLLIIEAYTPDQIGRGTGGPPVPEAMLTAERVTAEWPDLELEIAELEREVVEGPGHSGLGSVIQVIGHGTEHS